MQIKSSKDNILFLEAETQYELASTFMRMQEYYESPKFRGALISLEEYMDWYAKEYGNFTYMSDWNGFNVPGTVVRKFFELHQDILLDKERKLYSLLEEWIKGSEKFYVIGVWQTGSIVNHEFSHAFYYLDSEYQKEMKNLLASIPAKFRDHCEYVLKEKGYHPAVFTDESIAYLATNTMSDTADMFTLRIPWRDILPLQLAFEKRIAAYNE